MTYLNMLITNRFFRGGFYLNLFLLFSFMQAFSQTGPTDVKVNVTGSVYEQDGPSLPFAVISAINKIPSGEKKVAVSDLEGNFKFRLPRNQTWHLQINMVGYKSRTFEIHTDTLVALEIGKITLTPDTFLIKEVQVKPLILNTEDVLVYNISMDPERAKLSMAEIVKKVPGLVISPEGKIQAMEAEKKVIITRNGKKDAIFKGQIPEGILLEQISAMGFDQIRVEKRADPRFGPDNLVIDFVTDKTKRILGWMISPGVDGDLSTNSFTPNFNFAGSIDKLRFSGRTGYGYADKPLYTQTKELTLYETGMKSEQKQTTEDIKNSYDNKLDMSYDLTKKTLLNIGAGFQNSDGNKSNVSLTTKQQGGVNTVENDDYTANTRTNNWNLSFALDYDIKSREEGLIFSYLLQNNSSNETELYHFQIPGNEMETKSTAKSLINQKFQLDYFKNSKGKLFFTSNVGYFIQNADNSQIAEGISSVLFNSMLKTNYHVADANVMLYAKISKKLTSDLRMYVNYLNDRGGSTLTNGEEKNQIRQKGFTFSPSLRISYSFGDTKKRNGLSLMYTLAQNRPNNFQLDNTVNTRLVGYITQGNPYLKNEDIHSFQIFPPSIGFLNILFTYSFSNNKIGSVWKKQANGDILETYENTGSYRSYEFRVPKVFNLKQNKLYINTSPRLFYEKTSTTEGLVAKRTTLTIQAMGYYRISKKTDLNFDFGYSQSFSTGYSGNSSLNPFKTDMGIAYGIVRKGKTIARISIKTNPAQWGKNGNIQIIESPEFRQSLQSSQQTTPFSFSFKFYTGKFNVEPVKPRKNQTTIGGFSPIE